MSPVPSLRAIAGLGARILGSRWSATRPFKVTLVLTDRCDCRCEGCWIWKKPKGREMSPEEIGAFLRDAPSLRWVNLTGGEPFLRDDIPEVVEAVCAALPHLAVLDFPTTGQRTDTILEGAQRIAALGIPRFYVTCSVEGPQPLHDELRGRPGAFDNVMRTYRGLRAMAGVKTYLGMTLTDRNAHLVEETLDAVREHVPDTSWRDLHLNVYTESGHYYGNEDAAIEPPRAVGEAVEKALRSREGSWDPTDLIEATYLRHLPEHLKTGRSPLPCKALRAGVFVAANGDVYPCTVYDRVLGNVLEQPLYEILGNKSSIDARDVIARDACPGCWSPCEANPTIVSSAPESLMRRPKA